MATGMKISTAVRTTVVYYSNVRDRLHRHGAVSLTKPTSQKFATNSQYVNNCHLIHSNSNEHNVYRVGHSMY